ncbi:primosomal protein N' [Luteococcus sanguinis]|uniref:Probable replication restart protein PriA n=1 Tax=Luteococcus sanguinis TaxID=174038 RepID=A0ABW1X334_9ACTN
MESQDALLAGAPPARGIARVALDVPLPHLDRFFDYEVAPTDEADAVVGARVRTRFAGQLRDGFIVERPTSTDVAGRLSPLGKVVSAESVLGPTQIALVRAVADHCAGSFADVMRLAVPPRHAATEKAERKPWPEPSLPEGPLPGGAPAGPLGGYPCGTEMLDSLASGGTGRWFWQVAASTAHDPWVGLVQATVATLRSGRGVLVLVPDIKDLNGLRERLGSAIGASSVAVLHADLGQAARYRNFLALSRGEARVVIGTRAAAFAPMRNLGLTVLWDDGDDLWSEPRAPYFHARDVAAIRSTQERCALLFAGHARSCEMESWIERGWVTPVALEPGLARREAPAIRAAADSDKALERDPLAGSIRLPQLVFETIRAGLAAGPVLVQVPRAGYLVALSCQTCRTGVRCPHCQGPVTSKRRADGQQLSCGWCGKIVTGWRCPSCGDHRLRAPVVGADRTAEELGRAFAGTRVVDSSGGTVVPEIPDEPALVIATPGGEPHAPTGYAAAVLLDAMQLLGRLDLRAGEEALRRWLNAAALVRPGSAGGTVAIVGPANDRTLQALVRLDPAGFARRELAERFEARFPPAVKFVTLEGRRSALDEMLAATALPEVSEVLGPVPTTEADVDRLVLRTPLSHGRELTRAVKAASAVRSAKKMEGSVRVRVDPAQLA